MTRQIAPVGLIEETLTELQTSDAADLHAELHEFRELGDARMKTVQTIPQLAGGRRYTATERGYLLGLAVGRTLALTMSVAPPVDERELGAQAVGSTAALAELKGAGGGD